MHDPQSLEAASSSYQLTMYLANCHFLAPINQNMFVYLDFAINKLSQEQSLQVLTTYLSPSDSG